MSHVTPGAFICIIIIITCIICLSIIIICIIIISIIMLIIIITIIIIRSHFGSRLKERLIAAWERSKET